MGYPGDSELHHGRYLMPVITPDNVSQTAQILLDLADDRRHVKTSTDYPTLAFVVPDYLYQRWQNYLSLESSSREKPKNGSKK